MKPPIPPAPNAALRALALGLAASAFFAVTFVLNRSMANANGHWAWTASLRFIVTVPLALAVVTVRGTAGTLREALLRMPRAWLAWGTVGFAVFYTPLALAGELAPAWVVAGIWPITIVAGLAVSPLLYRDHRRSVPWRAACSSGVILAGVALVTLAQARSSEPRTAAAGLALVLVSAFAYPVGNRKMMLVLERFDARVDPFVRLAGMTLGSCRRGCSSRRTATPARAGRRPIRSRRRASSLSRRAS